MVQETVEKVVKSQQLTNLMDYDEFPPKLALKHLLISSDFTFAVLNFHEHNFFKFVTYQLIEF